MENKAPMIKRPVSLNDQGIGHVGLRVSDLARSRRFYDEILGLKAESKNPAVAQVRCGSDTLIIYEDTSGGSDFHFGFRLSSASLVEDWKNWIRSKKIIIQEDIAGEGHARSFKFRDPDGYLIEISSKT